MWIPGQNLSRELTEMITGVINDKSVSAELSKQTLKAIKENTEIRSELLRQIRAELDKQSPKGSNARMTYESLTSGDVNMQARMAVSGYDVYGRTVISGQKSALNNNIYKSMKNKIKFGRAPQQGFTAHGKHTVA